MRLQGGLCGESCSTKEAKKTSKDSNVNVSRTTDTPSSSSVMPASAMCSSGILKVWLLYLPSPVIPVSSIAFTGSREVKGQRREDVQDVTRNGTHDSLIHVQHCQGSVGRARQELKVLSFRLFPLQDNNNTSMKNSAGNIHDVTASRVQYPRKYTVIFCCFDDGVGPDPEGVTVPPRELYKAAISAGQTICPPIQTTCKCQKDKLERIIR